METRRIDDAISMLSRAESWISNRARTSEDYRFAREMRIAAKDAEKELSALHRQSTERPIYVESREPEPEGCYCNAGNAPCNWCETHCPDCDEADDECTCGLPPNPHTGDK